MIDVHDDTGTLPLYRHIKRSQWGFAVLAWDHGDKRGFLFEDGKLRAFKQAFFPFLERVDPLEEDKHRDIVQNLQARVQRRPEPTTTKKRKAPPSGLTFDQQLEVFLADYPKGFQDPTWIKNKRGVGAPSARKRHRAPIIEAAQSQWAQPQLAAMADSGTLAQLWEKVCELLAKTDLVPTLQQAPLRTMPADRHEAFAKALYQWLHDDQRPEMVRLEQFIQALSWSSSTKPSWPLVTCFRALMHPNAHMCAAPTALQRQAAALPSQAAPARTPSTSGYTQVLKLGEMVRAKLLAAGQSPQDLMDVHDFITTTQRPSMLKRVTAAAAAPAATPTTKAK